VCRHLLRCDTTAAVDASWDPGVRHDRGVESVGESWGRIAGWLGDHLPAAVDCIELPAPESAISHLAATVGRELPPDLVAWLRMSNGMVIRKAFGSLLPTLYVPFSCEGMLRKHAELTSILGSGEDGAPAGTASVPWLDTFLPIGDSWSDPVLVVDLRPGEQYGCVGVFDLEAEGFEEPRWSSTAYMLSDVAEALVSGRPVLQDYAARAVRPWRRVPAYVPVVEDARLVWQPVDPTSADRADEQQ
jgi:cell wall assembly regulator SMI1